MEKIIIINGPNLNLLGTREPEIYGRLTFEDYFQTLKSSFPIIELSFFQSNHEGEIIDQIHAAGFTYTGIVLNAGAYTHTSLAIADAISAVTTPVIEVHISNVHAREPMRHYSMMAGKCLGVIGGFGMNSYKLAIQALVDHAATTQQRR